MITDAEMELLCSELEAARDLHLRKALTEDRMWRIVQMASDLLDRGRGGPYERRLEIIYSLVEGIWEMVRSMGELRSARKAE